MTLRCFTPLTHVCSPNRKLSLVESRQKRFWEQVMGKVTAAVMASTLALSTFSHAAEVVTGDHWHW